MRYAGKVVAHRMLLTDGRGPKYGRTAQHLRILVSRLRHKIENDPAHPTHSLTEPGTGYRLQPSG